LARIDESLPLWPPEHSDRGVVRAGVLKAPASVATDANDHSCSRNTEKNMCAASRLDSECTQRMKLTHYARRHLQAGSLAAYLAFQRLARRLARS
jgi:hypothetical protein